MKLTALFLGLGMCVTQVSLANVWLYSHSTRNAVIFDQVGERWDGTVFGEYKVEAEPKPLRGFHIVGAYFTHARVSSDMTCVTGCASKQTFEPATMWLSANPKTFDKQPRLNTINAPAGAQIVDATPLANGKANFLIQFQSSYRVDQLDGTNIQPGSDVPASELSSLTDFSEFAAGPQVLGFASQALHWSTSKTALTVFSGGNAGPDGGFDLTTGTVAVRGDVVDGRTTILRANRKGPLKPLSIKVDFAITQIAVMDGYTFVGKENARMAVFNDAGDRVCILPGSYVTAATPDKKH